MARRVDSLDVARGTAMLFVCLSHFTGTFLAPWANPSLSPILRSSARLAITISMIASPSFVIVSGFVVGYLYRCNAAAMPGLRRKLIDRGLFLLLIGHFLLALPTYLQFRVMSLALRSEMITDAIAVAIIIGPSLVLGVSSRGRLVVGSAILVLSWWVSYLGIPQAAVAVSVGRYVFGLADDPAAPGFPVVPWLGVYVLGTVLGEWVGSQAESSQLRRVQHVLVRAGASAVAIGAAFSVARHTLRVFSPQLLDAHATLAGFLAASRKFPPGPVYLLVFGGAALILLSKSFSLAHDEKFAYLARPLSAIGRASFFVFILQGYVYYWALPALDLPYPQLWPIYYLGTVLFFLAAAAFWNAFDANRYLTVGLWRTAPMVKAMRAKVRTTLAAH